MCKKNDNMMGFLTTGNLMRFGSFYEAKKEFVEDLTKDIFYGKRVLIDVSSVNNYEDFMLLKNDPRIVNPSRSCLPSVYFRKKEGLNSEGFVEVYSFFDILLLGPDNLEYTISLELEPTGLVNEDYSNFKYFQVKSDKQKAFFDDFFYFLKDVHSQDKNYNLFKTIFLNNVFSIYTNLIKPREKDLSVMRNSVNKAIEHTFKNTNLVNMFFSYNESNGRLDNFKELFNIQKVKLINDLSNYYSVDGSYLKTE